MFFASVVAVYAYTLRGVRRDCSHGGAESIPFFCRGLDKNGAMAYNE